MQAEIIVGRVSGVYGIQGWVKIHSFTVPIDNILRYSPWELRLPEGGEPLLVTATGGRRHRRGCIVRFDACRDRDAALGLVGADIVIARDRLPPASEEEYYWTDLIGCRVVNVPGAGLGRVERLIETGANDVLVVTGDRERLIPFLPETVILSVDLAGGVIRVDWDADF